MNPKRKIVFVYNPTSGTIRLIPVIPIIERFVNRDLYDFSIVSTQYRGHATELARQYAAQNYDARHICFYFSFSYLIFNRASVETARRIWTIQNRRVTFTSWNPCPLFGLSNRLLSPSGIIST